MEKIWCFGLHAILSLYLLAYTFQPCTTHIQTWTTASYLYPYSWNLYPGLPSKSRSTPFISIFVSYFKPPGNRNGEVYLDIGRQRSQVSGCNLSMKKCSLDLELSSLFERKKSCRCNLATCNLVRESIQRNRAGAASRGTTRFSICFAVQEKEA